MAKKRKDDEEQQDETPETSMAVNDAWTGMLTISLLALMIGTGFLYWDWQSYGDDDPKKIAVPKLTGSPLARPVAVAAGTGTRTVSATTVASAPAPANTAQRLLRARKLMTSFTASPTTLRARWAQR